MSPFGHLADVAVPIIQRQLCNRKPTLSGSLLDQAPCTAQARPEISLAADLEIWVDTVDRLTRYLVRLTGLSGQKKSFAAGEISWRAWTVRADRPGRTFCLWPRPRGLGAEGDAVGEESAHYAHDGIQPASN
jgi:hypothetical protein